MLQSVVIIVVVDSIFLRSVVLLCGVAGRVFVLLFPVLVGLIRGMIAVPCCVFLLAF